MPIYSASVTHSTAAPTTLLQAGVLLRIADAVAEQARTDLESPTLGSSSGGSSAGGHSGEGASDWGVPLSVVASESPGWCEPGSELMAAEVRRRLLLLLH